MPPVFYDLDILLTQPFVHLGLDLIDLHLV